MKPPRSAAPALLAALSAFAALALSALGEEAPPQYDDGSIVVPAARADEPFRESFSAEAADRHLRDGALAWAESRGCVTCHTSGAYLTLRPALTPWLGPPDEAVREQFLSELEKLSASEPEALAKGTKPAQAIYLAAGLAEWDHHLSGELAPETAKALALMLSLQDSAGSWPSLDCWPPLESDSYHLANVAAMAAATAPGWLDGAGPEAAEAVHRLRRYLRETPPPHDYGRALLLWTSTRLPGLLEPGEQEALVDRLRELQLPDGGWSLRTFASPEAWGDGRRAEKLRSEPEYGDPPSDGHQTGFVLAVLLEAGVAAEDPAVRRGLDWLLGRQRESGRWWTRSLNTDKAHYITYSGTALALLALGRAGELGEPSPGNP